MTLHEFKAWFEGFTEDMEAAPTEKQWECIKKRIDEIDMVDVTYPVFVDWDLPKQPASAPSCIPYGVRNDGQFLYLGGSADADQITVLNSAQAMCALGRAERLSEGG